jgi:hypothetical protein
VRTRSAPVPAEAPNPISTRTAIRSRHPFPSRDAAPAPATAPASPYRRDPQNETGDLVKDSSGAAAGGPVSCHPLHSIGSRSSTNRSSALSIDSAFGPPSRPIACLPSWLTMGRTRLANGSSRFGKIPPNLWTRTSRRSSDRTTKNLVRPSCAVQKTDRLPGSIQRTDERDCSQNYQQNESIKRGDLRKNSHNGEQAHKLQPPASCRHICVAKCAPLIAPCTRIFTAVNIQFLLIYPARPAAFEGTQSVQFSRQRCRMLF